MADDFDVPFNAPAVPLINVAIRWDWPEGFSVTVRWRGFGALSEWEGANQRMMSLEEAQTFLGAALDRLMS